MAATLALAAFLVLAAVWIGYLPEAAALNVFIAVVVMAAVAWFSLRGAQPERLSDPGVRLALILGAGVAISYLAFAGSAVRPLFIGFYLMAYAFGVLTLDLPRLVLAAVFYLGCYAGVVGFSAWLSPATLDGQRELFRFLFLAITYAWGIAMGAVIARLRTDLSSARAELTGALRKSEIAGPP
ncbi:MAG: hypothetical protein ACRERU_10455 [Methylococcales bacterium]